MNLDDLPPKLKFAVIAMLKTAIYIKKAGQNREYFLGFAHDIWDAIEENGVEIIDEVITSQMKQDLKPLMENYIQKNQKDNEES